MYESGSAIRVIKEKQKIEAHKELLVLNKQCKGVKLIMLLIKNY